MYHFRRSCLKLVGSLFTNNCISSELNLLSKSRINLCNKQRTYLKHFSSVVTQKEKNQSEVHHVEDLVNYVSNARRVEIKFISEALNRINNDNLTENHVLFLLECCGKIIPGESLETKHSLCESVYQKFQSHLKYSEKVYNTFIRVCTENRQLVNLDNLILNMGPTIPHGTLRLLLINVCERGDTVKALKVIELMKKSELPLDELVFNNLILCHILKGGLSSGQPVLQAMITAKLTETNRTRFAIIKGLASRNSNEEFIDALTKYPVQFDESMVLELLENFGFSENYTWLKYILKFIDKKSLDREFMEGLERLCMSLIHNKKYDPAIIFHGEFVEAKPDVKYGASILREMLICSVPTEKIVAYAKQLKESGINEYALEDVTGLAMRYKLTKTGIQLLKNFDVLRPHYFWPVILKVQASDGEKGMMEVIAEAEAMNVKFDYESFQNYILPYCDLNNPKRIIQVLQVHGYTVRTLLPPMLAVLLTRKNTGLAIELCEEYKNVRLEKENLLAVLPHTWINTTDYNACLSLIQRISEDNDESLLGAFLTDILSRLKNPSRLTPFLELLRDSKNRRLRIDANVGDNLVNILRISFPSSPILSELEEAINDLLDFTRTSDVSNPMHPRHMNTEQLECHLIELKTKNLETRGVVRRLIQKHSSEGNLKRVEELEEELASRDYSKSPGMKSSLMHKNIMTGKLKEALHIYKDLKANSPEFTLDVFKLIDLAKLLVENNDFERAFKILEEESENRVIRGGRHVEGNCRNLLIAITNMEEQKKMFDLLTEKGFCNPSNIVLGPIIQLHLEKDNLKNTVDLYVDFAEKYRKTPLQVVLICETLKSGDQELLHTVLDATSTVHGKTAAHCALISGLCESGLKNKLAALLQQTKLNPCMEMEKRCDRWLQTNDLAALQTLLEASRGVSPKLVNRSKVQLSIMQIHSKNNDCERAVQFWRELVDNEELISADLDMEFNNLLDRCKYKVPDDLELKYRVK